MNNQIEVVMNRAGIYAMLAKAYLYPEPKVLKLLKNDFALAITDALPYLPYTGKVQESFGHLKTALADCLKNVTLAEWQREYNRLFGHGGFVKAPAYETEYTACHIFMQQQQLADIAGFYRAFGLEMGGAERVDHLTAQLEYMSWLGIKEINALERDYADHVEICTGAQQSFLQDHLGVWVTAFKERVMKGSTFSFYLALAQFTDAFIDAETEYFRVNPDKSTGLQEIKDGVPDMGKQPKM